MPTSFGGSSKDQKGKKPHKNKPTSQKYKKYSADGKKGKVCPRCGPANFLAIHKDRVHCGKCNYSEFTSKK